MAVSSDQRDGLTGDRHSELYHHMYHHSLNLGGEYELTIAFSRLIPMIFVPIMGKHGKHVASASALLCRLASIIWGTLRLK
jgi:hypothetical protein